MKEIPFPSELNKSIKCDICPSINDPTECNNDNRCYWDNVQGETYATPACKNNCGARKTKGQCEQFHKTNRTQISDTIYDFDGKDHKCKWYPSYFNIDVAHSSKDGICREANPSPCPPSVNKKVNMYCNYNYIPAAEETCLNMSIPTCEKNPKCVLKTSDFECVSDGEKHFRKGKIFYKTNEECNKIKLSDECDKIKGCITKPSGSRCIAKIDIPSPTKNACKPLKALVPNNYDLNLLEEENAEVGLDVDHSDKPPYLTSKYLCDICSIRNKDINNPAFADPTKDPLFRIKNLQLDKKQYCENSIDPEKFEGRKPCIYDSKNKKCISRCKAAVDTSSKLSQITEPTELNILKNKCIKTLQYSGSDNSEAFNLFPDISDSSSNKSKFNDELYCSWDGFECHNSIPCKKAQQIRCEDLGYDWYQGTAQYMDEEYENINLDSSFPIKSRGDGNPVLGDQEGVCIFPNHKKEFITYDPEYVINAYSGGQGILLKWSEWGTGWWKDDTLMTKRKFIKEQPNLKGKNSTYYLGDNIIFIPYEISTAENTRDIKNTINNALRDYKYFALNGEYVIWAKDIKDWCDNEYKNLFYGANYKQDDNITTVLNKELNELTPDEKRKYCGYHYYYKKNTLSLQSHENEEIHMCNTIYDLRGSINLIPVISGKALLRIDKFNINSNNGAITFVMTHPNTFRFIKFIGQEIWDNPDEIEKEFELLVLSKYKYEKDNEDYNFQKDNPLLPGSIAEGYGSLYEFTNKRNINIDSTDTYNLYKRENQQLDKQQDKQQALFQQIDYVLKYFKSDIYRRNFALWKQVNDLKNHKLNYINYGSSIETSRDLFEKLNLSLEDIKRRLKVKNKVKHTIKLDDYEKTIKSTDIRYIQQDIDTVRGAVYTFGSGSLESHKLLTVDEHRPKYQKINLMKRTPFVKLMLQYARKEDIRKYQKKNEKNEKNKDIIVDNNNNIRIQKSNYNGPGGDDRYESVYNIIPGDIRRAVIWSMTRNTHPFFGDLVYDPNIDRDLPFIKGGFTEFKKHLLEPFSDTNIKWESLMGYLAGNYNIIQRLNGLPNPEPTTWPSKYKTGGNTDLTIINNKKTYYDKDHIDYLYLTPNNTLYDNDKSDVGDLIDSTGKRYTIPRYKGVNEYFFRGVRGKNDEKKKQTYRDYYAPGKWLIPIKIKSTNDITNDIKFNWPSKSRDDQEFASTNGKIQGETHIELLKLKNVCFPNLLEYTKPTPLKKLKWNGDYQSDPSGNTWPQNYNDILSCTRMNTFIDMFKPTDALGNLFTWDYIKETTTDNITGLEAYKDKTWDYIVSESRGNKGDLQSAKSWSDSPFANEIVDTSSAKMFNKTEDNKPEKPENKIFMNKICPASKLVSEPPECFGNFSYRDGCAQSADQCGAVGGIYWNWYKSLKRSGHTCVLYCKDKTKNGLDKTNLKPWRFKGYGIDVPNYWNKEKYFTEDNLSWYNWMGWANPTKTTANGQKAEKTLIEGGEHTATDLYNYWNKQCDGPAKTSATPEKPIGWKVLPTPYATPTNKDINSFDKKLGTILNYGDNALKNLSLNGQDPEWEMINAKGKSDKIIYNGILKGGDTEDIMVQHKKGKNLDFKYYPEWVNNSEKIDCKGLLSYTPMTTPPKPTSFDTISLDNCALPLLDLTTVPQNYKQKLEMGRATILNNEYIFKEFANNGFNTIRDVCPLTCQSYTCDIIPPISELTEYNLFAINHKVGKGVNKYKIKDIYPAQMDNISTYSSLKQIYKNSFKNIHGDSRIVKYIFTINGQESCKTCTNIRSGYLYNSSISGGTENNWGRTKLMDEYPASMYNEDKVYGILAHSTPEKLPNLKGIFDSEYTLSTESDKDQYSNENVCKHHMLTHFINTCSKSETTNKCIACMNDKKENECSSIIYPKNFFNNICDKAKDTSKSPWQILTRYVPNVASSLIYDKAKKFNPYINFKSNNCNTPTTYKGNIKFKKIKPDIENQEFFRPARRNASRIFSQKDNYGCIRDDIVNVDETFFDLNCNANTPYSIERSKYVMINYIIQHSNKNCGLNITDRTQLALMNEEELLNKALECGINLSELNKYTKPKLISTVSDIYNTNLKRFEKWDDLQTKYLNIPDVNNNIPKLGNKKWDYIGCSFDFNNDDDSKMYESCQDKYPGLCSLNYTKCNERNANGTLTPIAKQMIVDCPETCHSQFKDLDEFKTNTHIGSLSICTDTGRCKSKNDKDPSNLLPTCAFEFNKLSGLGDPDTCRKVLNNTNINKKKACVSLRNCEYIPAQKGICHVEGDVIESVDEGGCLRADGTWIGGKVRKCLKKDFNSDIIGERDCKLRRMTWIPKSDEECLYNPNEWVPREDPCHFPNSFKCPLIKDEGTCRGEKLCDWIKNEGTGYCREIIFGELSSEKKKMLTKNREIIDTNVEGMPYKIKTLLPACTTENKIKCDKGEMVPDAFKITYKYTGNPNIKTGDYVHIGVIDIREEECLPFINGYSKVLKSGLYSGTEGYIYIKGPEKAYALPRDYYTNKINVGNCYIKEIYSISVDSNEKKGLCENNTKGRCTIVDTSTLNNGETYCKSCSLIKDAETCYKYNDASSCGWGPLKNICKTMGKIDDCNEMYLEGCKWDIDNNQCDVDNKYSNNKDGCMKCNSLKSKDKCNSLMNCTWQKEECISCNSISDKDKCNSTGACTYYDNHDGNKCKASSKYPFIYQWIEYNYIGLLSLIVVTIVFIISLYFWTSFNTFNIVKILLFLIFIMFILPQLFNRADGKDGRKYYRILPKDPDETIGIFDLLTSMDNLKDGQIDSRGALWPQTLYDEEWDENTKNNDILNSIVNFTIDTTILATPENTFFGLKQGWNIFINSIVPWDKGVLLLLIYTIYRVINMIFNKISGENLLNTFETIIYEALLVIFKKDTKEKTRWETPIKIFIGIIILGIILIFILWYHKEWSEDRDLKYSTGDYSNNVNCKYGECGSDNKPCRDNRSILAIDEYDDNDYIPDCSKKNIGLSREEKEKEIRELGSVGVSNICPPPFTCKAHPSKNPEDNDAITDACKTHYETYQTCPTSIQYEFQTSSKNKTPKYGKCKLYETDDEYCPFPTGKGPLGRKSYRPIEVLKYVDPTSLRAIPTDLEEEWEQKVRYEIVTQNYIPDLYK